MSANGVERRPATLSVVRYIAAPTSTLCAHSTVNNGGSRDVISQSNNRNIRELQGGNTHNKIINASLKACRATECVADSDLYAMRERPT